jgi:hypothetical protein
VSGSDGGDGFHCGQGLGEDVTAQIVELEAAVATVIEVAAEPVLDRGEQAAADGIDAVPSDQVAKTVGSTARTARIFAEVE